MLISLYLIGIATRTRCLHDAQTCEPPQGPGRMELLKDGLGIASGQSDIVKGSQD
jgi:hypothetical protein